MQCYEMNAVLAHALLGHHDFRALTKVLTHVQPPQLAQPPKTSLPLNLDYFLAASAQVSVNEECLHEECLNEECSVSV